MYSAKIDPKSVCIFLQNMKGTCCELNICIPNGDFRVGLLWGVLGGTECSLDLAVIVFLCRSMWFYFYMYVFSFVNIYFYIYIYLKNSDATVFV